MNTSAENLGLEYQRGVRRVLLLTLALNLAVVAGKLIAGLLAGSLSVISDAIHSATDSLNNIIGLVVTMPVLCHATWHLYRKPGGDEICRRRAGRNASLRPRQV